MGVKSAVLATLVLLLPAAVSAQSYAIQGTERYFRVESAASQGRRGPVVSGYVHNIYGHTADRVRLVIESLDGAGQVTDSAFVYIVGSIGPGDRAYFEAPPPRDGANYRIRVISFDPVGRGQ
jgi:hypothetical protein